MAPCCRRRWKRCRSRPGRFKVCRYGDRSYSIQPRRCCKRRSRCRRRLCGRRPRRAKSYEATDKLEECLADFKNTLELEPAHQEAASTLICLPPLIEQRNGKLKTEMLGILTDLANMFLKPFGLSTENFKMEQDPESKGHKINFKR